MDCSWIGQIVVGALMMLVLLYGRSIPDKRERRKEQQERPSVPPGMRQIEITHVFSDGEFYWHAACDDRRGVSRYGTGEHPMDAVKSLLEKRWLTNAS